jgi:RimJ/RimL family protein N-acetyltransferase
MEPVTLTTDRLVLSLPTATDVEAIEHACQDPEIPKWTTVPSPYTRKDAEDFVDLVSRSWAARTETVWGIRHADVLVGMIGLHDIAEHPAGGHAELGFWVAEPARGKGYIVEAAAAVVDWGFAELGLARIRWQAVAGNIPSARTARVLGFRYEGLQRQALTSPRGRDDGWLAGLLATDDRTPVAWPVLD